MEIIECFTLLVFAELLGSVTYARQQVRGEGFWCATDITERTWFVADFQRSETSFAFSPLEGTRALPSRAVLLLWHQAGGKLAVAVLPLATCIPSWVSAWRGSHRHVPLPSALHAEASRKFISASQLWCATRSTPSPGSLRCPCTVGACSGARFLLLLHAWVLTSSQSFTLGSTCWEVLVLLLWVSYKKPAENLHKWFWHQLWSVFWRCSW